MHCPEDTAVTASTGNVFADLGFENPALELAKAQIVQAIAGEVGRRGLSLHSAGRIIGLPPPKLSTLLRGRWSNYSVNRLVPYATLLGVAVTVRTERPESRRRRRAI